MLLKTKKFIHMMTNSQILNGQLECRLQHREHNKLNEKK